MPKFATNGDPLYATLSIPDGALFGNVVYVPADPGDPMIAGKTHVLIESAADRAELEATRVVLVSFGEGLAAVPAAQMDAELATLEHGPQRRARLVPIGSHWMRVDWLVDEGDTVRVRDEAVLSVVMQGPYGPASCEIPDVPSLGDVCCVPVVLVRTTGGDGADCLRWVVLEDVTPVPAPLDAAVIA